MRLSEVLANVPSGETSHGATEIGGISIDSRMVRKSDLFVALRGERDDGHAFLAQAARAGAAAALVERKIPSPPLPTIAVASTASALPLVAANFHGDPTARLIVVGVTGTNGKTTVTYLLESILSAAGHKTAVIGTINYRVGGEVLRKGLTTPFPHELQEVMAEAASRGVTHVLMEVSSHSAAQGRIAGVRFDVGAFTNLSREHLDFHRDMESYFAAKARFFREYLPCGGKRTGIVINADDPYGTRLLREFPGAMTYGFLRERSVHPVGVEMSWEGTRLLLRTPREELDLRTRLVGSYNASNVMAAVCVSGILGIRSDAIREGVERLPVIPGRMEEIHNRRGLHIYVDFAHTPEGLDVVLSTLEGLGSGRLIAVFGCGGNRDRGKRPEMGRIAALRSDVVIATSDNPRNEDPVAILSDILPGLRAEGFLEARGEVAWDDGYFEVIPDRKAAIARALSIARPGDTVAIAGKGHENVQIIGDRNLPFDDREILRGMLASDG
ncbi:MAG TPA: UDP-N-acetylmuramoyl-L-alanyl-D-glutamate--2,6-diaminopimelate ligase [Candidatus Limnocylindrales bacterium]|nr:UDP-N-acetylmuramoyl-L-alanyl-D-glutamate--2,6-diaminopimelate ligase [Candidatus Limnocylindrales bacterium]